MLFFTVPIKGGTFSRICWGSGMTVLSEEILWTEDMVFTFIWLTMLSGWSKNIFENKATAIPLALDGGLR